jgi:hypothetical protein
MYCAMRNCTARCETAAPSTVYVIVLVVAVPEELMFFDLRYEPDSTSGLYGAVRQGGVRRKETTAGRAVPWPRRAAMGSCGVFRVGVLLVGFGAISGRVNVCPQRTGVGMRRERNETRRLRAAVERVDRTVFDVIDPAVQV